MEPHVKILDAVTGYFRPSGRLLGSTPALAPWLRCGVEEQDGTFARPRAQAARGAAFHLWRAGGSSLGNLAEIAAQFAMKPLPAVSEAVEVLGA